MPWALASLFRDAVTFVWPVHVTLPVSSFAVNWPQSGITFAFGTSSRCARCCGATDIRHRKATGSTSVSIKVGRCAMFGSRPGQGAGASSAPFASHFSHRHRSLESSRFGRRRAKQAAWSESAGQKHLLGAPMTYQRAQAQETALRRLWERDDSQVPASLVDQCELPGAVGLRAAGDVVTSVVQGCRAAGLPQRRAAQAATARPGLVDGKRRQPEGGRCRQGSRSWQQRCVGQPDRVGRAGVARKIGSAGRGGGTPSGQDLAVSNGRMHPERFTVSGCPDQEIRNADL